MSQLRKVFDPPHGESLDDLEVQLQKKRAEVNDLQSRIQILRSQNAVPLSATKSALANVLAGALAGCCEIITTMPLDVIKTQMQVHPGRFSGIFSAGSSLVRTDGVRALYLGLFSSLAQVGGKVALRFTAFDQIKTLFTNKQGKVEWWGNLGAGMAAGGIEALLWTTPCERIKVLQQCSIGGDKRFQTLRGTGLILLKEQGLSGLFVGLVPTIYRQAISVGVRFMLYGVVKDLLEGRDSNRQSQWWHPPVAGASVGMLSIVANHPFDVIKSQVQADMKFGKAKGMYASCQEIIKQQGIRGFSRGLSPRVMRVGVAQAVVFTVYEHFLDWIKSII